MIIKLAIALAVVLTVAASAAWAFLPARHLPGNHARHLRIRLHLRLHPGKGFAHAFSLHLRWSRLAALRRSSRIRPSLPLRYRFLDPREHSVFLGRAHYQHGLRVPLEEHLLVVHVHLGVLAGRGDRECVADEHHHVPPGRCRRRPAG